MIDRVYQELVTRRSDLIGRLNVFQRDLDTDLELKVKRSWNEFSPSSARAKKLVAVDGGQFVKELRTGTVFVLNVEALITEGVRIVGAEQDVKSGVFRPGNKAKERVGELMALMELMVALKAGTSGELILMDGSLRKKLGEVKRFNGSFNEGEIRSLEEKDEDYMLDHIIYEKQAYLAELIKRFGSKVVWISKVSRSRDLFHHELSDVAVLEITTSSPGYSSIVCGPLTRTRVEEGDVRRGLEDKEVCSFYARLDHGERVLRIDVIGVPTPKFIESLLQDLYSVSIKGYPYPLVRVHYDVKVSRDDRKRI
ncbi:MAG: DNA double-strand break repair nuclease NurA, partial [Metallosphaera sp.]